MQSVILNAVRHPELVSGSISDPIRDAETSSA